MNALVGFVETATFGARRARPQFRPAHPLAHAPFLPDARAQRLSARRSKQGAGSPGDLICEWAIGALFIAASGPLHGAPLVWRPTGQDFGLRHPGSQAEMAPSFGTAS